MWASKKYCIAMFVLVSAVWPLVSTGSVAIPRCGEKTLIQWDFGAKSEMRDDFGAGSAEVDRRPRAIVLDSYGNIYIGDSVNDQVVKFDNKGKHRLTIPLQKSSSKEPVPGNTIASLAVDKNDNLYVLNFRERRIEIYSPDGTFKRQFSVALSDLGNVYANRLDIGVDGNVYVYRPFFINGRGSIYSSNGEAIKENIEESYPDYFNVKKFIKANDYRLSIENRLIDGEITGMVSFYKDNKLIGVCGPVHLDDDSAHYIDNGGNIFLFESVKMNDFGTLSYALDVLKITMFNSIR